MRFAAGDRLRKWHRSYSLRKQTCTYKTPTTCSCRRLGDSFLSASLDKATRKTMTGVCSVYRDREVGGYVMMMEACLCCCNLLHCKIVMFFLLCWSHSIYPPSAFIGLLFLLSLLSPVTPISCHFHHLSCLSLVTFTALSLPLLMCRSSSRLIQPMPCIPTDSVWEFFSHTAYYNQRLQWVEAVEGGNRCGDVPVKQPRLTRVGSMVQHGRGRVPSCGGKKYRFKSPSP